MNPGSALAHYWTLGKSLPLSEHPSPLLQNGDNTYSCPPPEVVVRIKSDHTCEGLILWSTCSGVFHSLKLIIIIISPFGEVQNECSVLPPSSFWDAHLSVSPDLNFPLGISSVKLLGGVCSACVGPSSPELAGLASLAEGEPIWSPQLPAPLLGNW